MTRAELFPRDPIGTARFPASSSIRFRRNGGGRRLRSLNKRQGRLACHCAFLDETSTSDRRCNSGSAHASKKPLPSTSMAVLRDMPASARTASASGPNACCISIPARRWERKEARPMRMKARIRQPKGWKNNCDATNAVERTVKHDAETERRKRDILPEEAARPPH